MLLFTGPSLWYWFQRAPSFLAPVHYVKSHSSINISICIHSLQDIAWHQFTSRQDVWVANYSNSVGISSSIYFPCRQKILVSFNLLRFVGFEKWPSYIVVGLFSLCFYDIQILYKNEWETDKTYWCWCMTLIDLIWRWQTSYNLATVSEDCAGVAIQVKTFTIVNC